MHQYLHGMSFRHHSLKIHFAKLIRIIIAQLFAQKGILLVNSTKRMNTFNRFISRKKFARCLFAIYRYDISYLNIYIYIY